VARTGRKVLGGLLVLVVILVVVAVVADRLLASYAEDRVAEAVADEVREAGGEPGSTTVDIDGFPFVTQALRERFEGGDVTLTDVRAEGVTITRIDLDVFDVRVPRDVLTGSAQPHDMTAKRIDGTATVPVSSLAAGIGLPGLTLTSESGALRARLPITLPVVGQVQVEGLVEPEAEGRQLRLRISDVRAAGVDIPQQAVDALERQLGKSLELPLPFEVEIDEVTVDGGDLKVTGTATDVPLS
jgi:hypothetical protein